jgi:hypothetical protein
MFARGGGVFGMLVLMRKRVRRGLQHQSIAIDQLLLHTFPSPSPSLPSHPNKVCALRHLDNSMLNTASIGTCRHMEAYSKR